MNLWLFLFNLKIFQLQNHRNSTFYGWTLRRTVGSSWKFILLFVRYRLWIWFVGKCFGRDGTRMGGNGHIPFHVMYVIYHKSLFIYNFFVTLISSLASSRRRRKRNWRGFDFVRYGARSAFQSWFVRRGYISERITMALQRRQNTSPSC